jgi:hypothetical protein
MCLAVDFGGGDKRAHWGQKVHKVGLAAASRQLSCVAQGRGKPRGGDDQGSVAQLSCPLGPCMAEDVLEESR